MPRRERLSRALAFAALLVLVASPAAAQPRTPPPKRKNWMISTGLMLAGFGGCIGNEIGQRKLYANGYEQSGRIAEVSKVIVCAIGPSAGQIYTDSPGRVALSGGMRAAGIIAVIIGHRIDDYHARTETLRFGSIFVVGTMIYDFIAAPRAAGRYNRRFETMTITPAPMTTPSGTAPGLVLSGSF